MGVPKISATRWAIWQVALLAGAAFSIAPAWLEAQASLPPPEEYARQHLDRSPRHGEWVKIQDNRDTIEAWVVYPERSTKAPVVIVIHEIYGLTDWIRAVADQLAAEGFLAIAPDLVSGKGPGGGGTASVDRQEVVKLVRGLAWEEVTRRLNATARYATALPAATKRFAVVGFCWGGGTAFRYAAEQPELSAAVVYYGPSPEPELAARIHCPVLGLYGGDDARVNETIPPIEEAMRKLSKRYEKEIYPGAGHGFLRQQSGREGANQRASAAAWPRTIRFLRELLEQ